MLNSVIAGEGIWTVSDHSFSVMTINRPILVHSKNVCEASKSTARKVSIGVQSN